MSPVWYGPEADILMAKSVNCNGKIVDVYGSTRRNIYLYDLESLFQTADVPGWKSRPFCKANISIEHSYLLFHLFYTEDNKEYLIGFTRATVDFPTSATLWDVVVHPVFQGKGLGKAMICQVVLLLKGVSIPKISLFAEPNMIEFYKYSGFVPDINNVKCVIAMH